MLEHGDAPHAPDRKVLPGGSLPPEEPQARARVQHDVSHPEMSGPSEAAELIPWSWGFIPEASAESYIPNRAQLFFQYFGATSSFLLQLISLSLLVFSFGILSAFLSWHQQARSYPVCQVASLPLGFRVSLNPKP